MRFSKISHPSQKQYVGSLRLLVAVLIAVMSVPLPRALAEAAGEQTRNAVDAAVTFFAKNFKKKSMTVSAQAGFRGTWARATDVKYLRLCPKKLLLYVGENFTLVPLPLDDNKNPVHGAAVTFATASPALTTVSSTGEVMAVAPGQTQVTVAAGNVKTTVDVEIRAGVRPRAANKRQADLDWEAEHAHDCDESESTARLIQTQPNLASKYGPVPSESSESGTKAGGTDLGLSSLSSLGSGADQLRKQLVRSSMIHRMNSNQTGEMKARRGSFRTASKVSIPAVQGPAPILDGDGEDPSAGSAASPFNAVGSPRFAAVELAGGATKTRNILGSYDYVFTAPVLSLPSRGIGVNLALTYNSRLWSKEASGMVFNYGKGWPAPGWTLGYGRLVDNYDGQGNWLLIQPDGTRTHLRLQSGTLNSTDGSFINVDPTTERLRYPDGTLVDYDDQNGRVLPKRIRTRNGDVITIAYRTYNNHQNNPLYFPVRWAISQITDTLGRVVQFHYYGDAGYPEDATGAKPKFALAAITGPDQSDGTRTLVQMDYQTVTLRYNFNVPVDAPAAGSQITVMKRIYYPATGVGYLFLDYSTYGIARRISVRNNMTGANGAITDGAQIAYTKYDYTTIDPSDPYGRNQVGPLNDCPQYVTRREWWQDKIDGAAETTYTYSRTTDTDPDIGSVEKDQVSYPNGMDMISTSGTDQTESPESFGHLVKTEIKTGASTLRATQQTYVTDSSGGQQLSEARVTDEAGNTAKTTYDYGNFGRVANVYEYGFTASVQRKTAYQYSGALVEANILQAVKQIDVFDGSGNHLARTELTLDDYTGDNGMQDYPNAPPPPPQTHESSFNKNFTTRGNVTGIKTWVKFGPTAPEDVTIFRNSKYDIFGNVLQAQVSCCHVKNINYLDGSGNPVTFYSQPMSVTDGTPAAAPFLTTTYLYDFNTGLVIQTADPSNLATSFTYDTAWRVQTVTSPTGVVTTTKFDKDGNQNDQLAYVQQATYKEKDTDPDTAKKTITSKAWFDGGGRVLRSGTGAGASPGSFDVVKIEYDAMGRLARRSNPYQGDTNGNGSPGFWTTNVYDSLSRVTEVDLPDDHPMPPITRSRILTEYNGPVVTVTDQVGRKRRSQMDGLGRLVSVTEQDPSDGSLSLVTNYTYDKLDNLTSVNQGGQPRSFVYDALSRLTSQTTSEGDTVSFTYTDFDAVQKRKDARGVETHYKYDSLNRLSQVWYTGEGGSDDPTVVPRPPLPPSVAVTSDVLMSYNNFTSAQPGNGQIHQVIDESGTETYGYDIKARVSSKTRVIDSRSYQSQYQYNQANQLTVLIYPSGKRVRATHDGRARTNGLDTVDAQGNHLSSYITSVGYNTAGQVTSVGLGNGLDEAYGYSQDRLQLTSQSVIKQMGQQTTTLMSLTYGYTSIAGASGVGTSSGNSGQLMSITGPINGQTRDQAFTYDDLGRLATATGWGRWSRRFTYDRWGNRTKTEELVLGSWCTKQVMDFKPGPSGPPLTNQATSVENYTNCTYTSGLPVLYDAAGNSISYGGNGWISHVYDGGSRIVRFQDVAGQSIGQYIYDMANRRVKKVAGGLTIHYVWEGSQMIAEYNGVSGALISEYINAGSRMLVREQSGTVRYYHQDRLSTRLITDGTGVVKGTQDHMPFGEDATSEDSKEQEKHRFTSYERDSESKTDYAVNRQYGTAAGRFLQPDPIHGSIGDPQSLNRYAYAGNDPINNADPLGLDWMTDASKRGPGVFLDGFELMPEMWSLAFSLVAKGAADILPDGAVRNRRGDEWVIPIPDGHGEYDYINVSDLNDLWRSLPFSGFSFNLIPVGFQPDPQNGGQENDERKWKDCRNDAWTKFNQGMNAFRDEYNKRIGQSIKPNWDDVGSATVSGVITKALGIGSLGSSIAIGAAGSWLWRNGKELWNYSTDKDNLISQRESDLTDCDKKYGDHISRLKW